MTDETRDELTCVVWLSKTDFANLFHALGIVAEHGPTLTDEKMQEYADLYDRLSDAEERFTETLTATVHPKKRGRKPKNAELTSIEVSPHTVPNAVSPQELTEAVIETALHNGGSVSFTVPMFQPSLPGVE